MRTLAGIIIKAEPKIGLDSVLDILRQKCDGIHFQYDIERSLDYQRGYNTHACCIISLDKETPQAAEFKRLA